MSFLRLCIALSRPAGLFTVWSNCLAGWWLGGGGNPQMLPFLFAGATLLYLGGTFLNDAFDPRSDRQRPGVQPTATVTLKAWGLGFLALGAAGLFWVGKAAGSFGVALMLAVVLSHSGRRRAAVSALRPGVCRLCLYLIAASTATNGLTGWAVWSGLALTVYLLGVHFITRAESVAGSPRYSPIVLLVTPILLALIVDDDGRREAGLLLSGVLALWTARCLRPVLWSAERDIARGGSGLVAGIMFVDLLAAADAPKEISFVFLLLFGATRLLQRPGAA